MIVVIGVMVVVVLSLVAVVLALIIDVRRHRRVISKLKDLDVFAILEAARDGAPYLPGHPSPEPVKDRDPFNTLHNRQCASYKRLTEGGDSTSASVERK